MSDISVQFGGTNLSFDIGRSVVTTADVSSSLYVDFSPPNISVSLGANLTVNFPTSIQFDVSAFIASVVEYDSNDAATTAGVSYYKASAGHEGAYKGTFIIL